MYWHKTSEEIPAIMGDGWSSPCVIVTEEGMLAEPYVYYRDYDVDSDTFFGAWRPYDNERLYIYRAEEVEYWISYKEIFNDWRREYEQ